MADLNRSVPQAEEPGAVPARAGDGEGDLGQAAVGVAVPQGQRRHPIMKATWCSTEQTAAGYLSGTAAAEVKTEN